MIQACGMRQSLGLLSVAGWTGTDQTLLLNSGS
jgi:hypothetical protein